MIVPGCMVSLSHDVFMHDLDWDVYIPAGLSFLVLSVTDRCLWILHCGRVLTGNLPAPRN